MIEFGKTLRAAREAKGLTIGQVAESTRLMSSMIDDLEHENFSRIAAPIYGRGFVKLYCEAVGLDPKLLVAEFMEIFSGNRDVAIKERPTAATPTPSQNPESNVHGQGPESNVLGQGPTSNVPGQSPESNVLGQSPESNVQSPAPSTLVKDSRLSTLDSGRGLSTPDSGLGPRTSYEGLSTEPIPTPPPVAAPIPPKKDPNSLFDFDPSEPAPASAPTAVETESAEPPAEVAAPRLSRYCAPIEAAHTERKSFKMPSIPLPHIPAAVWRLGILALVVLGLLWVLALGVRTLYRATTGTAKPADPTVTAVESPKPAPKPTAKSAAKPAPKPAAKPTTPAVKPTAPSGKTVKPATPKAKVQRQLQKIPPLYID